MNDVKWIKITTDIFDDDKIQLIESMPDSDTIIVVWFKLLALAGKNNNNGFIMLSDKIPYTVEMLTTLFRRKQSVIELALKIFQTYGMIEILDNDMILITNWDKHQNTDKLKQIRDGQKERQRLYRERKKDTVMLPLHNCNASDIDLELDLDKELDKDLKDNNDSPPKKMSRFIKPTLDEVTKYCQERMNTINPQEFIDSNEAKGWLVGTTKTPMKDWKAVIRTWESFRKKDLINLKQGKIATDTSKYDR